MGALWEKIQPYLDPSTGLLMAPDGGTDNLVLLSAYLIRELRRTGDTGVAGTLYGRLQAYLHRTQVVVGLYARHPGDTSDNSVDNLIGTCYVSRFDASCILHRWRETWACFKVSDPAWRGIGVNWYGRFFGLKAYIKAAEGERLNWWDKMSWSMACLWSTYTSKGASDPLLQSLQNDVVPGCRFAKGRWGKKYNVGLLYAEYFGPQHPLTTEYKP